MQALIRSKSAGVTGGRGTAGAGPGRDLLYLGVGPCRLFFFVLLLLPCFFRALGLGTCLVGFLFPPSARAGAPPPPPAVALVVCGAPRLVLWCCEWVWAVLCGARCFAAPCRAVVRGPCCVVCSSVVQLAVSRWRWPRPFCRCRTVLRSAVLFCAVLRCVWCRRALSCAVVFSLLLCGVVVVLSLPARFCSPAGVRRWCCRSRPPGLCVVPSAGLCCRGVLACSALCGGVLLLAVLCCSGSHPVVLRGWRGAALRFLARLRLAACSAVLGGALLCCRALRRLLGCRVLVLCAVLSRCVLLWVALCRLVSVGVVRWAACCAALLFAAVCCAASLGVVSGCAVLCYPCCGLLFRFGRTALCCTVPPGAVLGRVASCCAVWCCAAVHCAVGVALCCVVSRSVVPLPAVACPRVLCGASGDVCFAACCAVLLCFVMCLAVWCLGALCCAVRVVSCCLVGVSVRVWCAVSLGAVVLCVASCCFVRCSAVAHCAVCVVLCCFCSHCLVLLRAVPCPRVLCHAVGCCAAWCGALLCCPVLCALRCVCFAVVLWCKPFCCSPL